MKTNRRWDLLAVGAVSCAALASAAIYPRLPDRVATHFNMHGQPDGWMSRPWAAAFLPVFGLAIWAVLRFAPRILPKAEKSRLAGDVVALVAAVTAVFVAGIHVVLLRIAITPELSPMRPTFVLGGMLLVALGLVLPRVRRNPLIGVRTPWTLTSDENWARTQRVGGHSMVVCGILTAIAGAVGGAAGSVFAIVFLCASGIVPVVYSLVLARRMDAE